jgi:hypothetical protein
MKDSLLKNNPDAAKERIEQLVDLLARSCDLHPLNARR